MKKSNSDTNDACMPVQQIIKQEVIIQDDDDEEEMKQVESRCKLCGFEALSFCVLYEHLMTSHVEQN